MDEVTILRTLIRYQAEEIEKLKSLVTDLASVIREGEEEGETAND